jgi:hypothetical protein
MKKSLIGALLILLIVSCSVAGFAYGFDRYGPGGPFDHRRPRFGEDARYIIHRTASIVVCAQQMARIGHLYFQLSQAIAHQQKSLELYRNGFYREASFHSLRARNIAFRIINVNARRIQDDFSPDRIEQPYHHEWPGDDELDRRLDRNRMNQDEDAGHMDFELDLRL